MAQGAVATLPTNGASLTADELREILECERIVRFRDAVLSGTHPRIKVPPHLARNVSSSLSPAQRAFAAAASGDSARLAPKLPQLQDSAGFASKPPYSQHTVMDESTYSVPAKPTRSEIDPVLLEKSDDLIKAEIMLQRQKLERALREQIEQQRLAAKALLQTSESLPDFDISDVFAKALTIVQPISSTSDIDTVVGAQASANDSFDENSFYSSQHDTPGPSTSSSEGLKDQNDSFSRGVDSTDQRPVESYSTQNQTVDREIISSGLSLSTENRPTQSLAHSQGSRSQRPTIAADHVEQNQTVGVARSIAAGVPIRDDSRISNENRSKTIQDKSIVQDESVAPPNNHQTTIQTHVQNTAAELLKHTLESEDPSPLIRAHNLSPVAPRPARVSPLATARNPPILQQSISIDEAPPAQVVALRSEPAGVSSSTDSSPRDAKSAGKRKERKKKRRRAASKDNAEQPDSPYIKPEPRSPSPFGVVPLPRPQKRLRQGGQYAAELNYDEPRYDQHVEELDRQPVQQFREPLRRPAYERYDDRYAEDLRPMPPRPSYHTVDRYDTAPSIHVVDRVGDDYVRTSDGHYSRRPRSPTVYAVPYQPTEGRIVRAASRALVDRHLHDEPRYYRESQIPARASVRPDAERSRSPVIRDRRSPIPMGPPRQPVRVVVDEYGREYIDPSPIPIMRQSVAPSIRPREPEFYYERAPVRAVAGRAPVEYEDDGVIYRRTSPNMPPPRRVITQPEYIAQPEYRPYRQREYSVRPVAPPSEEYIQIRGPDTRETSHFEGPPREYIPRAATSFRPIPQYVPRLQSVRPEPPSREYATSIHPEARREMATQPQREYSVRPIEPIPRREHLLPVPAGERYYEDSRPRPNEVAYMERPPMESADVIYMDDSRRDFYQ